MHNELLDVEKRRKIGMNMATNQKMSTSDDFTIWNSKTIATLIICILIPIVVGAVSALLTQDAMGSFSLMNKPPFAPPAWLFPIAWTFLYALMGGASFFIYESTSPARDMGLWIYVVQLAVNFAWSLIFFRLDAYAFAAVWLAALIVLIFALLVNTAKTAPVAMLMLVPYAAWCCFALYLNIGIVILN